MLTSLGFDTILVNNHQYDDDSLSFLFELLYPYDVRNFIFLFDFELAENSFSLESEKLKRFKAHAKTLARRGIVIKAYYNLRLVPGSAFNPEFKRLYASKKHSSLFTSVPLFTDTSYEALAKDINKTVYRRKAFPLISNFDMILETAHPDLCKKLIATSRFGFGLDINYIFDPERTQRLTPFLKNKSLLLPTVSHDIFNYVGIMNEAQVFLDTIGKKNYYQLCSQIRRCAERFNC